jgi:hypothetical protein
MTVTDAERLAWDPAAIPEHTLLGDAYLGMPRDPASRVPFIVRVLENPRSPLALPGAVDLFGHDCIHLVLARGLLPQDEAFVLGFTLGATRKYSAFHVSFFKWCASRLYPGPFRFDSVDAQVFEHGVRSGRASGAADLSRFDFRAVLHVPLGALRRELGLIPAASGFFSQAPTEPYTLRFEEDSYEAHLARRVHGLDGGGPRRRARRLCGPEWTAGCRAVVLAGAAGARVR